MLNPWRWGSVAHALQNVNSAEANCYSVVINLFAHILSNKQHELSKSNGRTLSESRAHQFRLPPLDPRQDKFSNLFNSLPWHSCNYVYTLRDCKSTWKIKLHHRIGYGQFAKHFVSYCTYSLLFSFWICKMRPTGVCVCVLNSVWMFAGRRM